MSKKIIAVLLVFIILGVAGAIRSQIILQENAELKETIRNQKETIEMRDKQLSLMVKLATGEEEKK